MESRTAMMELWMCMSEDMCMRLRALAPHGSREDR